MPEGTELTSEQRSALDAWARSTRIAMTQQSRLTREVDIFTKAIGPSGVGRGLSTFTRGLATSVTQMGLFKNATVEQQVQLQGYARSLGVAVAASTGFLTIMDKLEKKQGGLQRAYGLTNVSMSDYYSNLVDAADIAGVSGVEAAEKVVKGMLEQRRISVDNREEFDKLTQTFTLYATALSENFPEDFVRMQQDLGMNVEDISEAYERLGYNAANARVPFEQYKNTVIDTTSRFVQYGATIGDVEAAFNLFMDDVSKGTLTMGEAADAVNKILEVQKTAGGLQKRGMLSKYIGEEWNTMPDDVKKQLNIVAQKEYEKSFMELGVTQRQFVLAATEPETYAAAESAVFRLLQERFTREQMMQITPQVFTGEFFEMRRRAAAIETGAPVREITREEFREDILPRIAEQQKEWYTFMTKIVNELKGILGDMGPTGKVITSALSGLGGFFMSLGPQMLMMRAMMRGGGGVPMGIPGMPSPAGRGGFFGMPGLAGASRVGGLLTSLAGSLTLAVAAFGVWTWAIEEINAAGGFKKLASDIRYWYDILAGTGKEFEGVTGAAMTTEQGVTVLSGLAKEMLAVEEPEKALMAQEQIGLLLEANPELRESIKGTKLAEMVKDLEGGVFSFITGAEGEKERLQEVREKYAKSDVDVKITVTPTKYFKTEITQEAVERVPAAQRKEQ